MAKTAMQELIEWIDNTDNHIDILDVRNKAAELLEKEKQMIMNSWMDGKENKQFGYDVFDDAEKYYTYTFILANQ